MNTLISRCALLCAVAVSTVPAAAAAQTWTPPDARLVERARALLREVPLIDGHNDLPSELLDKAGGDPARADIATSQPQFMTDLPRLRAGGVGAQFWSAYVSADSIRTGASLRHVLRQIDMIHRMTAKYPDLELARTAADIERIHKAGRIASMIGVEGGHALENSLSALRQLHALGARYMTLTHSATIDWADAATDHPAHGGLTEFGERVVREMNRTGMFVDLSHTSPATMHDALRVSRAPVIFTHSSARALVDVPRNVPDDVLKLLPANGGVIMITFVPGFTAPGSVAWNARRDSVFEDLRSQVDDPAEASRRTREWLQANPAPRGDAGVIADHVDHARKLAGIDHVGIGSDFDGIGSTPVGLEDVSTFPVLLAELLHRGYSEQDVRKIAGLNLLRAMKQMEQVAARLQAAGPPDVGDLATPGR